MKRKLLSITYEIVRLLRRIGTRSWMTMPRLRGVELHITARISPGAIFEPSGGRIIIGARS